MVFDKTCKRWGFGLSTAWGAGSMLYRALGRLDATFGATTWDEALAWLATYEPARPISEIQYWGHGRWGKVLVDADPLDASALRPGHALYPRVEAVRERLVTNGDALVWLRTCEAFGARVGQDFASRLAETFRARVAGHTFIIGPLQSGLHGLHPGHAPDWSADEGIAEGSADAPRRAEISMPGSPRTITCFDGEVPADWFA
jgi:hypothetical protein